MLDPIWLTPLAWISRAGCPFFTFCLVTLFIPMPPPAPFPDFRIFSLLCLHSRAVQIFQGHTGALAEPRPVNAYCPFGCLDQCVTGGDTPRVENCVRIGPGSTGPWA